MAFHIPQRVKVESGTVYCPKIGWIRIRRSQEIDGPEGERLSTKSGTFKRDACGDWFVSLITEFEMPDTPLPEPKQPVGIDAGLKDFVTLSNGETVAAPQFFRRLEKKLTKAQRRLSRAKDGSNRRRKAKLRLARVHRQ